MEKVQGAGLPTPSKGLSRSESIPVVLSYYWEEWQTRDNCSLLCYVTPLCLLPNAKKLDVAWEAFCRLHACGQPVTMTTPPIPARPEGEKTANGVLSIEPEDYGSPRPLPPHQRLDEKRSKLRLITSFTPRGVMRLRYFLIVAIVVIVESLMMQWRKWEFLP